jgi:5-methylcytosine-specific restriction endonuclease McrA
MTTALNKSAIVSTVYNSIISRSFNTKLDAFLFYKRESLKNQETLTAEDFHAFKNEDEHVIAYEKAWQLGPEDWVGELSVKEIDDLIINWNATFRGSFKRDSFSSYVTSFRSIYALEDFKRKYNEDAEKRCCKYCEITDAEIDTLRTNGLIKTKRGRGFRLEIDRLNSNKEYWDNNIVLACYWCNNAKTDEFTQDEFKLVGNVIKKIWDERLKTVKSKP